MTKGTAVFLFGLLLLVVPALGIPLWWKQVFFIATGVILLGIGYAIRRSDYLRTLDDSVTGMRHGETFVETTESLFAEKQ